MSKVRAKKIPKTRQSSSCPIVGNSAELPTSDLPTLRDVLACMQLKKERCVQPQDVSEWQLCKELAAEVKGVWEGANSAIVTSKEHSIAVRIQREVRAVKDLIRIRSRAKETDAFRMKLDRLFDICACRCPMTSCQDAGCPGCHVTVHTECTRPRNLKIPEIERSYIYDQRQKDGQRGKMQIGGIDKEETERMTKKIHRKENEQCKYVDQTISIEREAWSSDDEEGDREKETTEEVESKPESLRSVPGPSRQRQNRLSLRNVAREAERWQFSDRAAAALATATLQDVGLVTEEDQTLVIDRCKIRRERHKLREELRVDAGEAVSKSAVSGIYFDGRKDDTLVLVAEQGKNYLRVTKEEHYVLVGEPRGQYLTHVTPSSGSAADITEAIHEYMNSGDLC